jgi:hypothetical protein
MGKQKTTQKKRPIQHVKVNSTTNDIKGRAPAFQEVSLLKEIKVSTKRKGYSIPRHTFLQSMNKEEMKYPHPDLFFPGECKFRDTFGRCNPLKKKLPPLSQLLKRQLNVFDSTDPRKLGEGRRLNRLLSMEEASYLDYSETVQGKRGERGEKSIVDREMLKEMESTGYQTDEDLDVVGDTLAVSFHRRVSLADRDRGFRRDSLSRRRSSDGSAFMSRRRSSDASTFSRNSLRSLNSANSGRRDSVESDEESNSTFDPMNMHIQSGNRRASSESLGGYSHASNTSYELSPAKPRILQAAAGGAPSIRDLYGDPSSDGRRWIERIELDEETLRQLMDGEDGEYDNDGSSSSRSESTSPNAEGQLMDPIFSVPGITGTATPTISNSRRILIDHEEDWEYDDDERFSSSASSYSPSSSWTSVVSHWEDGDFQECRTSQEHESVSVSVSSLVSDQKVHRKESEFDSGFYSGQSDDNSSSVRGSNSENIAPSIRSSNSQSMASGVRDSHSESMASDARGSNSKSVASEEIDHFVSTPIPENAAVDLQKREKHVFDPNKLPLYAEINQNNLSDVLFMEEIETAEDVVAELIRQTKNKVEKKAATESIHERSTRDCSVLIGLQTTTLATKRDDVGTSPKTLARPTMMRQRSVSFSKTAEPRDKSRLPRGVAQLPSWWVDSVLHVKKEHSSDERKAPIDRGKSEEAIDSSAIQSDNAVKPPASGLVPLKPAGSVETSEMGEQSSAKSTFAPAALHYSTCQELSPLEEATAGATASPTVDSWVTPIAENSEHEEDGAAVEENASDPEMVASIEEASVEQRPPGSTDISLVVSVPDTKELDREGDNQSAIGDLPLRIDDIELEAISMESSSIEQAVSGVVWTSCALSVPERTLLDQDEAEIDLEAESRKSETGGMQTMLGSNQAPAVARSKDDTMNESAPEATKERARKEKFAEDLFAKIVGATQQDTVEESLEERSDQPDGTPVESVLFSTTGTKFSFFAEKENGPEETMRRMDVKAQSVQEVQPLGEVLDERPPLVMGLSGHYDDLEIRWHEAGAATREDTCRDVTEADSFGESSTMYELPPDSTGRLKQRIDISDGGNAANFETDLDLDNGVVKPALSNAQVNATSRWIIKSTEWKGIPGRKKAAETEKKASTERRTGSIGRRIKRGLRDEVREAHALKAAKFESSLNAMNTAESTMAVGRKGSPQQHEDKGRGLKGFGQAKSESALQKTPWYRGVLSWKRRTKENFVGWSPNDDDSVSAHSETASLADNKISIGARSMWRQDLKGNKPLRRHSWSASSAADSGDSNSSDYEGSTRRRRPKRRTRRSSRASNQSIDIDEFLQHEGMPIDLISDSGDEAGNTAANRASIEESTEVSQDVTEIVAKKHQAASVASSCEGPTDVKATPGETQDNRLAEADEIEKQATMRDSDEDDNLDVFEELDCVAEAIQSARVKLAAHEEEEETQSDEQLPDLLDRETESNTSSEEPAKIESEQDMKAVVKSSREKLFAEARTEAEQIIEIVAVKPTGGKSVAVAAASQDETEQNVSIDFFLVTDLTKDDSIVAASKAEAEQRIEASIGQSEGGFHVDTQDVMHVSLKEASGAPAPPNMLKKESNSTDTLDSWVPPETLSERKMKLELLEPKPEKVSKWKKIISRHRGVLFQKKKRRLDDEDEGSTDAFNVQPLVEKDSIESNVGINEEAGHGGEAKKTPEASMEANIHPENQNNVHLQSQDNMKRTTQSQKGLPLNQHDLPVENVDVLSIAAKEGADGMKYNLADADEDSDESVNSDMERAEITRITMKHGQQIRHLEDLDLDDTWDEIVQDDDSTVVSYLDHEGEEDDDDKSAPFEGDEGNEVSALTLFLVELLG